MNPAERRSQQRLETVELIEATRQWAREYLAALPPYGRRVSYWDAFFTRNTNNDR